MQKSLTILFLCLLANIAIGQVDTLRFNCSPSCTKVVCSVIDFNITANNVTCNGGNNGSLTLMPLTGTAPYTYLWNTGATSQSINNLTAATYFATVTDANDCEDNLAIAVTAPSAIVGNCSSTDDDGTNNGAVDLTLSGGTAPYTYVWSNGATTKDLTNLAAGTYTVTITDNNNCQLIQDCTVGMGCPTIQFAIVQTPISCFGGNDGALDLTTFFGTPPYTYLWSNGATTEDISGLSFEIYSLTVTDANGCIGTIADRPFTASELIASCTSTDETSGNNGTIDLTVSGGTSPYTYVWNNGATTQDLTGLASGTYTVTITDNKNCQLIESCVVNNIGCPIINVTITKTDETCDGANDGAADATVTGGLAPYSYAWNNGATTEDISNLAPGTYSLVATDANNCAGMAQIIILQSTVCCTEGNTCDDGDNCTENDQLDASCNCVGTPIAACTFTSREACDDFDICTQLDSLTRDDCTGLICIPCAGTPKATQPGDACDDGMSCTTNDVIQSDCQTCMGVMDFQVTSLVTHALCHPNMTGGASVGDIDLTVTGGAAPYTYLWSNGATTQDLTNLSAGNYTVTVTDANGCSEPLSFMITQPSEVLIDCTSVGDDGSNNGSINLTVSGGTTDYTYLWNNGATTQDLNNLAAGNYSVTVTDANGCIISTSCNVEDISCPVITVSIVKNDETCDGADDGNATASASGGASPYTYSWSNGANTNILNNVTPGTYTVTATDVNGCLGTISVVINASTVCCTTGNACDDGDDCTLNDAIDANCNCVGTPSSTQAGTTCDDGNNCTINDVYLSDCLTCQGTIIDCATAGQTVTNPCDDLDPCTENDVETRLTCDNSICVPCAGTPKATQAGAACDDGMDCTFNDVILADCETCQGTTTNIQLGAVVTQPQCHSTMGGGNNIGAINLTVTGGQSPYTYAWSNGATTEDINATQGNYSVIVTDANGCVALETFELIEPTPINFDYTITNASCNTATDGSITISNITGGVPPYVFNANRPFSGLTIPNLGDIHLVVMNITDANGCIWAQVVNFPSPNIPCGDPCQGFVLTGISSSTTCEANNTDDGSIDLTVTAGLAPYTYAWDSGQTTEDLTDLVAGTYNVTVTDANGCQAVGSYTVLDADDCPDPCVGINIQIIPTVVAETCPNDNDGQVTISVSGASFPVTVTFNGNNIFVLNNAGETNTITGLVAGSYSVLVVDANGCLANVNVTVPITNNPAICDPCFNSLLVINELNNVESCKNQSTGQLVVDATGGTAPYTFAWSNGGTGNFQINIVGDYTVTATDAEGCTAIGNYTIPELSEIRAFYTTTPASCIGAADGSINLDQSGSQGVLSNGTYTHLWSTGATTEDISGLTAGIYTVTVTESIYSCTVVETIIVPDGNAACCDSLNMTSSEVVTCADEIDGGTAVVTISGGQTPYQYQWSNGQSIPSIFHSGGPYSLSVTDANSCEAVFNYDFPCCYPVSVLRNCDDAPVANARVLLDGILLGLTDTNGEFLIDTCLSSTSQVTITTPNDATNGVDGDDLQRIRDHIFGINLITDVTELIAADINGSGSISTFDLFLASTGNIAPTWRFIVASNYPTTFPTSYDEAATINQGFNFKGIKIGDLDCEANAIVCECTQTISATANITNDINLNGTGSIDLTVSPSGGYFYSWTNLSTGQYYNTEDLTGLSPGDYKVMVSDGCGCTFSATYTVGGGTCLPIEIDGLIDGSCREGNLSLDLTVTGGTLPYSFDWSNGEMTEDLSTINSGVEYTVTVTDAAGCQDIMTFNSATTCECNPINLSYDIEPFCQIKEIGGVDVFRTNGAIDLTVDGGTPPYTYHWTGQNLGSGGNTLDAITQDIDGQTGFSDIYLSVADAAGCVAFDTLRIPNGGINFTTEVYNNLCAGENNGSAIITDISNQGNSYNINWSTGATGLSIENLPSGDYDVTLTNDNNCKFFTSTNIAEPIALNFDFAVATQPTCTNRGSINILVNNGTLPYTYEWSNGATTEDLSNLGNGSYTVTVTDANGCTLNQTFQLNGDGFDVVCGTTNIQVSSGQGPFTYLWDNGATTTSIPSGYHSVTVTDTGTGCTQEVDCANCIIPIGNTCDDADPCTENDVIQDDCECRGTPKPDISGQLCDDGNPNTFNDQITCDASCVCTCSGTTCAIAVALTAQRDCEAGTASISTTVTGSGYTPYTYAWSNGSSNAALTNLPLVGTYTVTVTDAVGCSTIETLVVNMDCTPESFCELNLSDSGGSNGFNQTFTAANDGIAAVQFNPYDLPDGLIIKVNGVSQIDICHSNTGTIIHNQFSSYANCLVGPTANGFMPPVEYFTWQTGDLVSIEVIPNCGNDCDDGVGLTKWDLAINCVDYIGQLALDIGVSCEDLKRHYPIRPIATGGTPPYTFEIIAGLGNGEKWQFDPLMEIVYGAGGNLPRALPGCNCSERIFRVTDAAGVMVERRLTVAEQPCCGDSDWSFFNFTSNGKYCQ